MPDPILDLILRRSSAKNKLKSDAPQLQTMASPAFSEFLISDEQKINAQSEIENIDKQIYAMGFNPDEAQLKIGDLPDNTPDHLVRDLLNTENKTILARRKAAIKWQAPVANTIESITDPEQKKKAQEEMDFFYKGFRGAEGSTYQTALSATQAAKDIINKYNGTADKDEMLANLRFDSEYGLAKMLLKDPLAQKRWDSLGLNQIQGIALDIKNIFEPNGGEFEKQITLNSTDPSANGEKNFKLAQLENEGVRILGNQIDYLMGKNAGAAAEADTFFKKNEARITALGKEINSNNTLSDELKNSLLGFQKEYSAAIEGRDGEAYFSPYNFDVLKSKVDDNTATPNDIRQYNIRVSKLNQIVEKYKGNFDAYNETNSDQSSAVRDYNKIVNTIKESYSNLEDNQNLSKWAEYLAKQRGSISDRYPEYKQIQLEGLVKDIAGDNVGLTQKTDFRLANSIAGEAVDGIRKVWNNLTIWDGDKLREVEMGDAYRRRVEDVMLGYETGDQMLKDERNIIPIVQKDVQEQLNKIKSSNLSEEEKYQQNYKIVSKAFDDKQIQYVANPKYGKYNITSDAILNTISSVTSQFLGQMAQAYLSGGFGNVSKLRRLATLFGTTAAQTYSREYDAAVQRGDATPSQQAIVKSIIEGLSELPFDNIQFVKKMSPQFRRIAGDMTQAEWAALKVGKLPKNLGKEFVGAIESLTKEGALEEGLAQVGGNIADKYMFGKDKDISDGLDVSILAGVIGFAPLSIIGLPMKYRSANMGDKLMMYHAGFKADQVIANLNQQVIDGDITAEEAKQRTEALKTMKEVVGGMSMYDVNGKPLTDNQKAQYAWNEYVKIKSQKTDNLPSQQKKEIEEVAKEADQSSSNILNGTDNATSESTRPMQGMPTEGRSQQSQAVGEGQQGQEQATQPTANVGDSNISSQGEVDIETQKKINEIEVTLANDAVNAGKSGEAQLAPEARQSLVDELAALKAPKNTDQTERQQKANIGYINLNGQENDIAEVPEGLTQVEAKVVDDTFKAAKSLSKTGIKLRVFKNQKDFEVESAKLGQQARGQGVFMADGKNILINLSKIKNTNDWGIVWHEASHPVMNIIRNTNPELYNKMAKGFGSLAKQGGVFSQVATWAQSDYGVDTNVSTDEAMVETVSLIGDGKIGLQDIPVSFRQQVIDFVNTVADYLGLGQLADTSERVFVQKAAQIANSLKSGEDISSVVGNRNVMEFMNSIDSPEVVVGGMINEAALQARVGSVPISVYESKDVKNLPRRSLKDVYDQFGGRAIAINSDPTRVGELTLPSGKKIFMYGGPAYLSLKENSDSNIGFATTQISKVNSWAKYVSDVFGDKPGVTFVATQAPTAILSNSYSLRYVMDAISKLPKSVLKSAEFKNEFFGNDLVLLKDAFGEKGYNDFVTKYKKADLSNDKVIDDMIAEMAYKVGDDNKPASFKARGAFVSNLLGGLALKSEIKGVEGDKGYVSKKPNKFIAKQLMDRLGINAEKVMRDIGEPSLVDLYINDGKWGFVVSGFETDPNITIDSVQSGGVQHPLFNAKFPGKNAFILDGAYDVNQMFTPIEMISSGGNPYTKTAAQMLAGSMYVKGREAEGDGAFEYKTPEASGQKIQEGVSSSGLIAPNGKPSKLSEKQYKQVRTPEFKAWFGDWENDSANASKALDENGEPIVVYHGTGTNIEAFDSAFTGKGNDQYGSGFYFTTKPEEAEGYKSSTLDSKEKLGGTDNPNVIKAVLRIKKPIEVSGYSLNDADIELTEKQAFDILMNAPDIMHPVDSPLGDWYESYWSKGPSAEMVRKVAKNFVGKSLTSLEGDFFKEDATKFREAVNKVLGYDGVVQTYQNGTKHFVAWFPNQVKSATTNKGAFSTADNRIQERRSSPFTEVIDGFYSPIEDRINTFKQTKASVQKWKEIVGVKSDEAVYSGMADWLGGMKPDQQLSKEDVMQFMNDNRIQIKEVSKSDKEFSFPDSSLKEMNDLLKENDLLGFDTIAKAREAIRSDEDFGNSFDISNTRLIELGNEYRSSVGVFKNSSTKYSQYQLPGGENYKEVLITLPSRNEGGINKFDFYKEKGYSEDQFDAIPASKKNELFQEWKKADDQARSKNISDFRSTHFDEPNIITHLRMNTRTDADGKKVLFLEEVQSDWGQKGKREGFDNKEKWDIRPSELYDGDYAVYKYGEKFQDGMSKQYAEEYVNRHTKYQETNIPPAPFVTNTNAWVKLGLKVALKEAVKQGADRIAWTTGEQQNERYDLSKSIDEIQYVDNGDGTYSYSAIKGKSEVASKENADIKTIESELGKDIADKILSSQGNDIKVPFSDFNNIKSLTGQDLKVGGKGMKAFYGDAQNTGIVGNVAKALVKELTGKEGKIEASNINIGEKSADYNWTEDSDGVQVVEFKGERKEFNTEKEAKAYIDAIKKGQSLQPAIEITPELSESITDGVAQFKNSSVDLINDGIQNRISAAVVTSKAIDNIKDVITKLGYGYLPEDVREKLKTKQRIIDADINEMNVLNKRLEVAIKNAYGIPYKKLDASVLQLLDKALRNFEGETLANKTLLEDQIPEPILSIIEDMRSQIDSMSLKLTEIGVLDNSLEPSFDGEKGLGVYVNRTYKKYDDPEWVSKIPEPVRDRAIQYLKSNNFIKEYDDQGNETGERQLTDEEVDGLVNYIATNMKPVMEGLSSANAGKTKLDILKGRKQIPEEIRDLMGEYKDPMVNFARSIVKMSTLVNTHQALKAIASENIGKIFFERPTGKSFVPVAGEDESVLQPLSGLYATQEIADAFKNVQTNMDAADINFWMLRTLAKINGIVKIGKTALSPASWVRNVIGGHIIMIKDGHITGEGYTEGWKKAIGYFANKSKDDPAFQSKVREYIEQGILGDGVQAGEFQAIIRAAQRHDSPIEWLQNDSKLGQIVKRVKGFYSAQDDIFRVWAYENEKSRLKSRKAGMTETELQAEASRKARATYPTYSELPEAIRQLAKFIPMSSFPAFSAELIRTTKNSFKIAFEEIGDPDMRDVGIKRLAGVISAIGFGSVLAGASAMLIGVGPEEEKSVRRYLPSWSRNSPLIWLGRDDNGMPMYIDLGFSDPFSYFKKPVVALSTDKAMSDRIKNASGELASPFISPEIFLSALMKGGKKLKETDDLDEVMGKYAGPVYEALEPGIAASLRRIGKGVIGDVDRYGQQYDAKLELFAFFSGQRIKKFDVPVGFSFKSKEFVNAKRDIMSNYYIEKSKTLGDPVKEAKELDAANQKFEKYYDEFKKDYDAALILMSRNMSVTDARRILKNILKDRNVPKVFIKSIEKNKSYPKFEDDK